MKNLKYIIITILLVCILVFMIAFSSQAKAGAINGIRLCSQIIIPALLPILIICGTITKSRCARVIELAFSPLAKLLSLPKVASCAIVLGLVGGYPTGAILTNDLFCNGVISQPTAKRIMSFNFCGGIAFVITAVGDTWLGSKRLGCVLYLINIISSMVICFLSGLIHKRDNHHNTVGTYLKFDEAVISAVNQSTNSILVMCCYIIFFSAIFNVIKLPSFLAPLLEITNGVFSGEKLSFEFLAGALGFGGLCVQLQLLQYAKNVGMNFLEFLAWRIAGGLISYFLGKIYTLLFPQSLEVFSNTASITPKAFEVNAPLSIVLLLGCIVLVVELNQKKSKLL